MHWIQCSIWYLSIVLTTTQSGGCLRPHSTLSLILSLKSHGLPTSVCIFGIDLMTWFVSLIQVTYLHIHLDWLHSAFENIMSFLCSVSCLRFAAFLWSPYVIGRPYIFSSCFFFFLLSFFFSSPNLSGRRLDVYHTLAHGVALVRI